MTRFARAKGSKSSNEKTPGEGTPWEIMKEQMAQTKKSSEETKNREKAEKQRLDNYEQFLKDRKVEKKNTTWCDFPSENPVYTRKLENFSNGVKFTKKKKGKKSKKLISQDSTETVENISNEVKPTKKKKGKKRKNISQDFAESVEKQQSPVKDISDSNEKKEVKGSKKKLKANKDRVKSSTTSITEDNKQTNFIQNNEKSGSSIRPEKKKKSKKLSTDSKPQRRKADNDRSFRLIINGKEVELTRFDGFPIMKKDAERLEELKSSMMKKGIPKIEVQRTIKLERRRAEKVLARMKRDVCYNCRKGGHNLSDCPDLKTKIPGVDAADGLCFKCGSTEHRQFECKVQRDKEFRFATCFICKEQGHIARQCPDNPKGLYPNGGACKLCGDVTHLKKDCSMINKQQESISLRLDTIVNSNQLEGIDGGDVKATVVSAKQPKKIKF